MGVTIHFEGTLKSAADLDLLIEKARAHAESRGWPFHAIGEARPHRARGKKGEAVSPKRGIELQPHDRCDPLRLEFDGDLHVNDFIKTQFAGVRTHVEVVELLRALEPHFSILEVIDEADYWTERDEELLRQNLSVCDEAVARLLREHPQGQGPVRMDSGRWVDFIS
jgi:hypothetical protein